MNLWQRLAVVFGAAVVVRLACHQAVPGPYILTDELLYTKLAEAFADGTPFLFRGAPIAFPSFLYPLAIAPATVLADPLAAFRAIQIANALLFGLAAIPLYLLAVRLLGLAAAPLATALALLPPYALQSAAAMSENLFFPLLCWAAYLLVALAERPAARTRFALAVALGLAFLTKPHGMTVVPMAFLATWFLTWLAGRAAGARGPRAPAVAWLPVGVYCLFVLGAIAAMGTLPGGGGPFDVTRLFGTYAGGFAGRPLDPGGFAASAAGNLLAIGAAVGFLPVALFAWFAVRSIREGPAPDRALSIWILALAALLVALTARHTVTLDDPARIHERYTFYVEPLIVLGACAAARSFRPGLPTLGLSLGLLAGALALTRQVMRTPVVADTLTLAAMRPLVEIAGTPGALLAGGVVAAGLLGYGWRALRVGRVRAAAGTLACYLVGLTTLALVAQHFASRHALRHLPLARWVEGRVPGPAVLAIVGSPEHLNAQLFVEFATRGPVRVFHDGLPLHHMNDAPVEREGSELQALSALPDGAAILTAGPSRLALPLLGERDGLLLYRKRGPVRETQAVTGRFPDRWTDGRCRIVETGLASVSTEASLRLLVDTANVPPALAPFPLTVADGTGKRTRVELPIGELRTVRILVTRRPDAPFEVELVTPTWSPAEAYRQADARRLGLRLHGAFFEASGADGNASVEEPEDQAP
ncbi:MAG: glycosyltransferase family 39 protein [Candidatus Sericytochromatia bacterium]|nr:glycosyltransferase family 39 protein [Candidatus Tanganyikabacteria bacterium]